MDFLDGQYFTLTKRISVANNEGIQVVLFQDGREETVKGVAIGIDAGGTGTRVVCADQSGVFASATGGPAALSRGIDAAWETIDEVCGRAFSSVGRTFSWSECFVAIGMAGAHNADWRRRFLDLAPDVQHLRVETDAFTTLVGAHGGKPGAIVAIGTGSVGEALYADGTRREVGGYGFPAGDEASGAWIGMRASQLVQKGFDGRHPQDAFFHALCSAINVATRADLFGWLACATPATFGTLARTVLEFANHPDAARILAGAGEEIATMIRALSPVPAFPVALCGGLGSRLRPYLPPEPLKQLVEPRADAAAGALHLAQLARNEHQAIA
ncbi:ATPase [Paraburkholderia sp. CNPSo 3272]|uniref:BadF/BadG/BcrA/BcrD ATPase family protein n=1 Tax=Paraburkholderia sp. CNPSo 3272 TaxID=2940931 RepID=UPI0020B769D0|nr:BadF/BadG/BcrA/BcrD ATPase family protein [Paraburkholderia sp. CNPSo 3272]MCP3722423.1 ATPase [Paraburkholderia sp. CNPSo 3272]